MTQPQSTLQVSLNGDAVTLSNEQLTEALFEIGYDPEQQGIAVAINMSVVPRSEWAQTTLSDGDRVDIVGAKQGG
ncbi:MAG: sulfur carrier protein ThiS [Chloroflexi bacterium]|nr:sulfur carrier protein ThiS [Chloroflexota bacterium]